MESVLIFIITTIPAFYVGKKTADRTGSHWLGAFVSVGLYAVMMIAPDVFHELFI